MGRLAKTQKAAAARTQRLDAFNWSAKPPAQILLAAAEETFALGALTGQLACAADGFSLFARLLLGGLFKVVAAFHLAEETFTLHLFLKRFQCLIDIVVANDDLNDGSIS